MATKEHIEFTAVLAREIGPELLNAYQVSELAQSLMRASRRLHVYAEEDCNVGLDEGQQIALGRLKDVVRDMCKPYAITPMFSGDPRGAVLKLVVPSGHTNDFGGEGIYVPR